MLTRHLSKVDVTGVCVVRQGGKFREVTDEREGSYEKRIKKRTN